MSKLPVKGNYPKDWDAIKEAARERAGHRCIRCNHPYRVGQHGNGEWSPCDPLCNHDESRVRFRHEKLCNGATQMIREAQWRILTVHHFDGDKSNNAWWNLLPLCQRCHLEIQGKVNPEQPYFFEHSDWLKPFLCGFLANKYLRLDVAKYNVIQFQDELLQIERRACEKDFKKYLSALREKILGVQLPQEKRAR